MAYITRITTWYDPAGNVQQVAVALLAEDWEALCEMTELVGPFDEIQDATSLAYARALAARARAMDGQLALLDEEPPITPGMPATT